jgi:3',5'-cyclic AMP phosphodiesterase CpdA
MVRLIHLTDLHFGFHRDELVAPLLARIADARPDLVVVTGDLTHRGREPQMRQARAFLDRIEAPLLLVPGNHDLPVWNVLARCFWPFAGWRRHFGPELTPAARVRDMRVLGVNSADPYVWQRGKIRHGEIGRVLGGLDPLGTNAVALHHPLQQLPWVDKLLARRAREALSRLEAGGVHLILSGHLHRPASAELLATGRYPRLLQIQSGTALCARVTDLNNELAVIDVDGPELVLTRHLAPMGTPDYTTEVRQQFSREDGVWRLRP